MTVYVALLRAVSVGGTGKLPMAELRAICEAAGFKNARTYIACGNVRTRGSNRFLRAAPNRTVAIFLDDAPPPDALKHVTGRADEEVRLGTREIYVQYSDGMADSKLKIPAAKAGTARNINTVGALVNLSGSV